MKTTKPVFRIGAAGLDPRDWRLIEIVFKHSQYNRFEFVLAQSSDPDSIDILIANTHDPAGVRAVSAVRTGSRVIPVIAAVPRGAPGAARHAISIDRLTLQLLPILNRVVELELLRADQERPANVAATPADAAMPDKTVPAPAPANAAVVAAPASGLTAGPPSAAVPLPSLSLAPLPPAPAGLAATSSPAASQLAGSPAPATSTAAAPDTAAPPKAMAAERTAPQTGFQSPTAVPLKAQSPASQATSAPRAEVSPATPIPPVRPGQPVESRPPAATASNLVAFPKPYSFSPPAPQQLRALIVDDSPTVRQQLQGALARMGLATHAVERASEALEMLAREYFDLILVDVVMPDVDGYKLTREIKRDKRFRQIPVIMLTSKASPFDLARGALAGCDSYLTKPVPLKALEKTVLKQLRKSLAIDDLSAMLRPVPASEPATPAPSVSPASSDVHQLGRR